MNTTNREAEKLTRQLEAAALGPDDTFAFSCDRCGRCCREREDILLNPGDLFRIAKFLGKTPREIVDTFCEEYIGPDSQIPVIRLKPKAYRNTCPFLGRDGCKIHAAKPTVCALFPLGRAYIVNKDKLVYFCQPITCGSNRELHTVREWLAEFGRSYTDEDSIRWMKLTPRLTLWMQQSGAKLREETRQVVWSLMAELCYLRYDTQQPFTEQFAENVDLLLNALPGA